VSELPSRTPSPSRSRRDTLQSLRLAQDHDGFLQMALLKLDLIFETDPIKRRNLLSQERVLEDMEIMDWPVAPPQRSSKAVDLGAVIRNSVELAAGDFPSRSRGGRPSQPSLLHSDPRATGSGRN
jgi:hypothetical protein